MILELQMIMRVAVVMMVVVLTFLERRCLLMEEEALVQEGVVGLVAEAISAEL